MNFPSLPNIVDLVALQNAIALSLCAEDRLITIPILPEIKLHMDNDVTVDALWSLPRAAISIKPGVVDLFAVVIDGNYPNGDNPMAAGPVGAGILVEMPEARVTSRNPTGPPLSWTCRIISFEDRNINLTANVGAFIMAEQMAQIVLDALQLQYIYPYGSLTASASNTIAPARDWETRFPGIVCYGTTMEVENGRTQTNRSANCSITFNAGMCTITCPDPTAEVRYTLDGTPALKSNPSSIIYYGPFGVASGITVIAASNKTGLLPSSVLGQIAP